MKKQTSPEVTELLAQLHSLAHPAAVAGMKRFGIQGKRMLGVSIPVLRKIGRAVGKDHPLALALWQSGFHEARILAAYVDDPGKVTLRQMDKWVQDFDSWDLCDQVCGNLFDRTPWAVSQAVAWAGRPEEFVKRAGFVLMASLAVHDKAAPDSLFIDFLPSIENAAADERNFVRKAVNWALRQIGKRNPQLNRKAIATAERILKNGKKEAAWVARDALRELKTVEIMVRS